MRYKPLLIVAVVAVVGCDSTPTDIGKNPNVKRFKQDNGADFVITRLDDGSLVGKDLNSGREVKIGPSGRMPKGIQAMEADIGDYGEGGGGGGGAFDDCCASQKSAYLWALTDYMFSITTATLICYEKPLSSSCAMAIANVGRSFTRLEQAEWNLANCDLMLMLNFKCQYKKLGTPICPTGVAYCYGGQ